MNFLDRQFQLTERGTNVGTEFAAGVTTFLTMCYIVFVQPAMLSGAMFNIETGMDFTGVMAATCIASAIASVVMALMANYPVALAPGMGINAYFVLALLPAIAATGHPNPWQVALGVVLLSGLLFMALTLLGVREKIFDCLSPSLKSAIAVGIGLFIAFIGLKNGELVIDNPATLVSMNHVIYGPDVMVFLVGLFVGGAMLARGWKGAVLGGIVASLVTALALQRLLPLVESWANSPVVTESQLMTSLRWDGKWLAPPPSLAPTFFKFDLWSVFDLRILPFVVVFLFIDMFDTIGTLIGVTQEAGLMKNGKLPNVGRAMTADATGTICGACLGTSTVTSYVESAAGVEAGGRTGLTAIFTAVCFLAALFFVPVVQVVGSYPPITASALVLVGAMMARNVREIEWNIPGEALPAFLLLIAIPLTFSIGDGIAIGLVTYVAINLLAGRREAVNVTLAILATLIVAYFGFIRASV
jgi:AGZA family xanthine/uracil permease-like MFS transporter